VGLVRADRPGEGVDLPSVGVDLPGVDLPGVDRVASPAGRGSVSIPYQPASWTGRGGGSDCGRR